MVRERAACSLAQSAMLSRDQRLIAVPQLITYTSDPVLDARTQALRFKPCRHHQTTSPQRLCGLEKLVSNVSDQCPVIDASFSDH